MNIDLAYSQFCKERFPLPTEEQILAVEKQIGASLPEGYRQYLLKFNGGFFSEPDITSPIPACPLQGLSFMNGIGANHPIAELARPRDFAILETGSPPDVLAIGSTISNYYVLMILGGAEDGCIVLKTFEECFFLANGIEEFFGLLREPSGMDKEL